MADQAAPGVLEGSPGATGGTDVVAPAVEHAAAALAHEAFHGRAVSWISVSVIFVGFIVGGAAMVAGMMWWLFWAGLAIVVLGGVAALATHITEDWY